MYEAEIQMMMYVFGDVRFPSAATAAYIEQVVRSQARRLLLRSQAIQRLRRGVSLEIEDLCFVLRRDREKVHRIIENMSAKMYRADANEDDPVLDEEETPAFDFDWFDRGECRGWTERLRRLNEHTSRMSEEEYIEYAKCREASFTYRKTKKFKAFVGMKMKDRVAEVLGFVCYEMVFELVNAALDVKRERCRRSESACLEVEEVEESARRTVNK